MCDCYPGCWRDHAKNAGWTKIEIPSSIINQKKVEGSYYPIHAAAQEIIRSEGIPYGDYVIDGAHLYVNPNYISGTKGVLNDRQA